MNRSVNIMISPIIVQYVSHYTRIRGKKPQHYPNRKIFLDEITSKEEMQLTMGQKIKYGIYLESSSQLDSCICNVLAM